MYIFYFTYILKSKKTFQTNHSFYIIQYFFSQFFFALYKNILKIISLNYM